MLTTTPSITQHKFDAVKALKAWCLSAAPAPMDEAATIFAITTVGGIAARSYNIGSSGLNQFWFLKGKSGSGKGIIADCRQKLFDIAAIKCPVIMDFKGTSYCASAPAQIKFLARKPYPVAITDIDEFAHDLAQMNNPRNDNMQAKQKFYLEIWNRGGFGKQFDPLVYSDAEKNVAALISPALTIVGVSTTQKGDEALTGKLASTGLLARFNVNEFSGQIAPFNADHEKNMQMVPREVVKYIEDLTDRAVKLAKEGKVQRILVEPEASKHFTNYAEELRLRRNAMSDFASDLLNRNHEKAMRTAGTLAVGCNIYQPMVTLEMAQWSTEFIDRHANKLLTKLDNGETGEVEGNETKQQQAVLKAIAQLAKSKDVSYTKDGRAIIYQSNIQQKLMTTAAFKGGQGVTFNIRKTIRNLVEAYALEELSMADKIELGTKAKVFAMIKHNELIKAALDAHKP
jgi:hypothetical protein